MKRTFVLTVFTVLAGLCVLAAPPAVRPEVTINCADVMKPLFKCGETAEFRIRLPKVEGADESCIVMLRDDRSRNLLRKTVKAVAGEEILVSGTLSEPGFLSCHVQWRKNRRNIFQPVVASAGFEVEKIVPGAPAPADFQAFWKNAKEQFDKKVAPDFQVVKLRDLGHTIFYEVTGANYGGTRTYAYISVPKAPGKYPALVRVPPAGPGIWRAPGGRGRITAVINVHHQKHGLQNGAQDQVSYRKLNTPLLYAYQGAPDREKYYYYKSILGVMRMLDYVTGLKEWDGKHLVMKGQSQGGAFALIMGGIYPKITAVSAEIPALCDHLGLRPGWPQLLRKVKTAGDMAGYYDTVNFCRTLQCPVIIAVGCIDTMCFPRSVLAAYNVIPGKDKKLYYGPFSGHGWGARFTEFYAARDRFVRDHLSN